MTTIRRMATPRVVDRGEPGREISEEDEPASL